MNTFGDSFTTRSEAMAAFDRLPPEVRQAIARAPFPYCPVALEKHWDRGRVKYRHPKEAVAAFVAFINADINAKLARMSL